MPTYHFFDKNTQEESTHVMRIADLDQFKKDNPNLEQSLSNLNLADPTRVGVTSKPDEGFRDVLRQVKKNNFGSNVNTF